MFDRQRSIKNRHFFRRAARKIPLFLSLPIKEDAIDVNAQACTLQQFFECDFIVKEISTFLYGHKSFILPSFAQMNKGS